MSRYLSTDIYSLNGELSFIIQHTETGIQYLSQLQYKFYGLVKSPTSALCCISQSFNVR